MYSSASSHKCSSAGNLVACSVCRYILRSASERREGGDVIVWLQERWVNLERHRAGGLLGVVLRDIRIEFGDAERGLHLIGSGINGVEDSFAEFERPADSGPSLGAICVGLVARAESSGNLIPGAPVSDSDDAKSGAVLRGQCPQDLVIFYIDAGKDKSVCSDVLVLEPVPAPVPEAC
jgi:hypothetical protein